MRSILGGSTAKLLNQLLFKSNLATRPAAIFHLQVCEMLLFEHSRYSEPVKLIKERGQKIIGADQQK